MQENQFFGHEHRWRFWNASKRWLKLEGIDSVRLQEEFQCLERRRDAQNVESKTFELRIHVNWRIGFAPLFTSKAVRVVF